MATLIGDTLSPTTGPLDLPKAPISSLRVKNIANADYTILTTDGYDTFTSLTTISANRTITLPPVASSAGRILQFNRSDSSAFLMIIDTPGSETIDGAAQTFLYAQYSWIRMYCDGSNWYTLGCWDYREATGSAVTGAASLSYANITSLSFGSGTWNFSALGFCTSTATTVMSGNDAVAAYGISVNSASATGVTFGTDGIYGIQAAVSSVVGRIVSTAAIPNRIVQLLTSTTYYFVATANYTGSAPTFTGTLRGVRIG